MDFLVDCPIFPGVPAKVIPAMSQSSHGQLKIVQIISGDLWAGAEVMACNLLKRLNDYSDLDLSVILLNEGRLAEELRAAGLTVRVIDEDRYSFGQIYREIRTIVDASPPHVLHSHRYKENLLAFLIAGFRRSSRLIATQHGLPEFPGRKPSIGQRLKIWTNLQVLKRAFTTVAVSEDIRTILVDRHGLHKGRIKVIHNGIELPPLPSPKDRAQPFVIGSSGRIFPIKDFPLLVEIARTLADSNATDIHFELAGDGPGMSELQALIRSYNLHDRFHLKGHQDDMPSFYRGLDLYLNTSIHEGIPITILEALAHGIPVIAPAVGGIVEIFDNGEEGYLIAGRNPNDFAEKCLYLKNNPDTRRRMARAARERAEKAFSVDRMAEEYYRLYTQKATGE